MKFRTPILGICTTFAVFLVPGISVLAQQPRDEATSRSVAYSPTRETIVQGSVLSYTENSSALPIGAHATIQTATGTVDVHLGPGSYLRANQFRLTPGDPVRFVGTLARRGKEAVFLARAAQSGSRAITIRTAQGFLLARNAPRASSKEQFGQAREAGPR